MNFDEKWRKKLKKNSDVVVEMSIAFQTRPGNPDGRGMGANGGWNVLRYPSSQEREEGPRFFFPQDPALLFPSVSELHISLPHEHKSSLSTSASLLSKRSHALVDNHEVMNWYIRRRNNIDRNLVVSKNEQLLCKVLFPNHPPVYQEPTQYLGSSIDENTRIPR